MEGYKVMLDLAIQNVWAGPVFFLECVQMPGILPTLMVLSPYKYLRHYLSGKVPTLLLFPGILPAFNG